jgi:hypothetical protein
MRRRRAFVTFGAALLERRPIVGEKLVRSAKLPRSHSHCGRIRAVM